MVILVLSVSVFVCVWILVPSLLHFLHDVAVFNPKFLLSYFVQFIANGSCASYFVYFCYGFLHISIYFYEITKIVRAF